MQQENQPSPSTYVIGDIHGHLTKLITLLLDAQLINSAHTWMGGKAILWFIGDLVDRGPDGIGVLGLVMRLQEEAALVG